MKKLALLGAGAGLGVVALLAWQSRSQAADHVDSLTTLATQPMADINDVYTWMTSDATKLNLVMTVSPVDQGDRHFDASVQYVFHVTSKSGLGVAAPGGTETQVICTFASDTSAQCWVVSGSTVKDYVTGDPSGNAGVASADGKVKVHAGRHSDPFFFNLHGFKDAIATVAAAPPGSITFNADGCPTACAGGADARCAGTAAALRTKLSATPAVADPPCGAGTPDCFASLNVLAIVVQVDKTLLNDGANTSLGVWASTHAGS